jgi:hypothetical protein
MLTYADGGSDVHDYFNLRARSLARVASLLAPAVTSNRNADSLVEGKGAGGAGGGGGGQTPEVPKQTPEVPKHEWSAATHINCCALHGILSQRLREPYVQDKAEAASQHSIDDKGEIRLVCSRMFTYAHVCSRMLTHAHVCSRMLTHADVC